MPDDMGFYEDMSAYENLDYTARFLGLSYDERKRRIISAVSKMGLEQRLFDTVRTYSHGMKRRLGLAEVLVKQPAIAILDEPTQGLDPHSTAEFLTMIRSLKKEEGMSVILASFHLNEVQSICDRVGLFHAGRMALSGTTVVSEDEFLLLSLFTLSREPIPSLLSFLSFLVPLTGIALGFDVVNSEFQNRTLKRVLSQPIHRDVLLFGKALGAFSAMAIMLLTLWLLVIGSAMLVLGLPPSTEQVACTLAFYALTLLYGMFWFLIAMFFSVVFKQQATSALVSLGLWLLFTVFYSMIVQVIATAVGGVGTFRSAQLEVLLSRISPNTLFAESALALLSPSTRTLDVVMFTQLEGALMGSPLPFGQSLLLIWPQLSAMTALLVLLFTASYVVFQRQEM